MNDVSENDAILIRKLAKSWLSLHAEMFREQPDVLDALLANADGWVTGYDEKQDYYWGIMYFTKVYESGTVNLDRPAAQGRR